MYTRRFLLLSASFILSLFVSSSSLEASELQEDTFESFYPHLKPLSQCEAKFYTLKKAYTKQKKLDADQETLSSLALMTHQARQSVIKSYSALLLVAKDIFMAEVDRVRHTKIVPGWRTSYDKFREGFNPFEEQFHNYVVKLKGCIEESKDYLNQHPNTSDYKIVLQAFQSLRKFDHSVRVESYYNHCTNRRIYSERDIPEADMCIQRIERLNKEDVSAEDYRIVAKIYRSKGSIKFIEKEVEYYSKMMALLGTQATAKDYLTVGLRIKMLGSFMTLFEFEGLDRSGILLRLFPLLQVKPTESSMNDKISCDKEALKLLSRIPQFGDESLTRAQLIELKDATADLAGNFKKHDLQDEAHVAQDLETKVDAMLKVSPVINTDTRERNRIKLW